MFKVPKVTMVRESVLELESRDCSGPRQVWEVAKLLITEKDKESFWVFMVTARNRLAGVHMVSFGTLTASLVHPREFFRPALVSAAAGVIAVHNHPSGDCRPSAEDRTATQRLVRAGRILGVPLLDHVIVADESHYSFRENGAME